jgi:hypothetical protein
VPVHGSDVLVCKGHVLIHHCHVLARYKNVSLTHQYITVMYWHGTRTCPLHTNTSLSCTGTVQERVPYTPIHQCHVLVRYKNVSLTHQYITVMYWHGTITCPLHTNTSLPCDVLVCKGHVLVPCQYMTVMYWCVRDTFLYPYTPIHQCHVLAPYKNVSLTHQYSTVMYWHGTGTCPLHTNTSCQYMTVMYWCVRDTFLYRAST